MCSVVTPARRSSSGAHVWLSEALVELPFAKGLH
jgi:hypothetical protein